MAEKIEYRGYFIHYDRKPVPLVGDWSFYHDAFDGAPDAGDHRCGHGVSVEDCQEQIDDQYVELELDEKGHPQCTVSAS